MRLKNYLIKDVMGLLKNGAVGETQSAEPKNANSVGVKEYHKILFPAFMSRHVVLVEPII